MLRPTTPTISAPLGEWLNLRMVAMAPPWKGCACRPPDVPFGPLGAANSWDSDSHLSGISFSQDDLQCDTWPHAVEIPIRRICSAANTSNVQNL